MFGESASLNTLWPLGDPQGRLFLEALRTKRVMVGFPTVRNAEPDPCGRSGFGCGGSNCTSMWNTIFATFLRGKKRQILPLLVQFPEQNSAALLF